MQKEGNKMTQTHESPQAPLEGLFFIRNGYSPNFTATEQQDCDSASVADSLAESLDLDRVMIRLVQNRLHQSSYGGRAHERGVMAVHYIGDRAGDIVDGVVFVDEVYDAGLNARQRQALGSQAIRLTPSAGDAICLPHSEHAADLLLQHGYQHSDELATVYEIPRQPQAEEEFAQYASGHSQ
ncbi:MAG: hypothetical protein ABIV43_01605 [Candidatus Saccharimonadales bacterium]